MTVAWRTVLRSLPEGLLLLAFLFFALRRLGTFPAAWADDSLFMLVAKSVAQGHGYALPVLGWDWPHPSVLAVGPTLILPVALAIKLGGFSVAAARMPMVLYLLGAVTLAFFFVKKTAGRTAARWTAALFISLSAFINTGKPVLGEVPGFFFVILGLLLMQRESRSALSAILTGAAFGLAAVTKLPYGLLLPALAAAWIVALIKRDRREIRYLTIVIAGAFLTLAVGAYWLGAYGAGFLTELRVFLFERKSVVPADQFVAIIVRPRELLRSPYIHYVLTAVLAGAGIWTLRMRLQRSASIIIGVTALLFALYFLNGPGWYRALLPSTLLLFLVAPSGARTLAGRWGSVLLLGLMVVSQGYWQWMYRGASLSSEAPEAAQVLEEKWREKGMVFLAPEVYVRLTENPRWLFLSEELRNADRQPAEIRDRIRQAGCFPIFRKESHENLQRMKGRYIPVSGRYVVLPAPSSCTPPR